MRAYLSGEVPHGVGESAEWGFRAPASLRLVSATVWRTGTTSGSGLSATPIIYLAGPSGAYSPTNVLEACAAAYACAGVGDGSVSRSGANRVPIPAAHIRDDGAIVAVASCGGEGGSACNAPGFGDKASIAITASEVILDDPAPPIVNASSGTLTAGGTLAGIVSSTVQASDVGSGLFGVGLDVDGQTVAYARVPDTSGRCAPVDSVDGVRSFLWISPCPPNGSATLEFDSRTIADGYRQISLYAEDAAGNRTVVGAGGTLVKNSGLIGPGDPPELRGPPNGYPVSDQGRLEAGWVRSTPKRCSRAKFRRANRSRCNDRVRSITRNASKRATDQLAGRLRTPDGAPIVGARVAVILAPRRGGGAPREIATAVTSETGRWSVRVRRQMSASVEVRWPARQKDTVPAALVRLTARVRARSSLKLSHRRIRTGRVLRISGKLTGSAGLKRGVSVLVQARPARDWRAVTTVRVKRDGTWSLRYRVPRQLRGSYLFRALVRPTPTYPYASGKTRSLRVRIR